MAHQHSIHWFADQHSAPENAYPLLRRGFELGWITENKKALLPDNKIIVKTWQADQPIVLPGLVVDTVKQYAKAIQQSHGLMQQTLNGAEIAEVLSSKAYATRLQPEFALVASSVEEHDEQGIEKLYFDSEEVDNLWCKASWLSFHDEDISLRFRFSFGMEGFEDVAIDPVRQQAAGHLCDRIFTESAIITENTQILAILEDILTEKPAFVERIVYFNAPNGGAQFHHDVERGHDGVVFAQLSGATFWLALNKQRLMDAICDFACHHTISAQLTTLIQDRSNLSVYMEEPDHSWVETLINHTPDFIAYLIDKGFGHILQAGDVLLLPQRDLDHCVWHSVFNLGENPGEALSFAVRHDM